MIRKWPQIASVLGVLIRGARVAGSRTRPIRHSRPALDADRPELSRGASRPASTVASLPSL
jgi:hypothetical protein